MFQHKFFAAAVMSVVLAAGTLGVAQSLGVPQNSANPCADRGYYPVIQYNAANRSTSIRMSDNGVRTSDATALFLCDGKPVEIFVINRRLLSSYTATLSNTFTVPNKLLDLRGGTPTTQQPSNGSPTTPPTTAAPAPAAKSLTLPTQFTNLLTTDKGVQLLLDDETFDTAFNQVSDHAAAVREEYAQLRANVGLFHAYLRTLTVPPVAVPPETAPEGELTLPKLITEWNTLNGTIAARIAAIPAMGPVDENTFKVWINQADRLVTESSRANTKLQQFPIVDTAINLTASLKTIQDNFRGVEDEEDSLQEAVRLIEAMGAEYRRDRSEDELTNALKQHYSVATISDPMLLNMIAAFRNAHGPEHLRVLDLHVGAAGANDICGAGVRTGVTANLRSLARYCGFRLGDGAFQADLDFSPARWHEMRERLEQLNQGIVEANNAQGTALRALNNVYDTTQIKDPQITNLNLGGAYGNLVVYYTLTLNEQFNRYQIVNEISEPISQCQLALSAAATSTSATGFTPCTTPAASTIPGPASTLSASAYPPLQPTPPIGTTAPTAPTASGLPGPPEYVGRVEVHHFSHGALVTGVTYEFIKQSSLNWVSCPTSSNPAFASGNPNNAPTNAPSPGPTSGPCASPQPPASGSTTPAVTYYQLQPQGGPTVAVVEGVNLFIFDNPSLAHGGARDMFKSHMAWTPLELYLAASAYPINHYYVGLTEEPMQGFHITGGIAGAIENYTPASSGYVSGEVSTLNSPIPTKSHLKGGAFIEIGFDTSLFTQIFNGKALQNVLTLGSAGGVPQPAPAQSQ